MTNPTLQRLPNIVVLGPSGAGKSTACEYISQHYGHYNFHPINFLKRFYEGIYGLNPGDLDNQDIKHTKQAGMRGTYQDIMVADFHKFCDPETGLDPLFTLRNMMGEMNTLKANNQRFVAQAIRSMSEATCIVQQGRYLVIEVANRGQFISTDFAAYYDIRNYLQPAASEWYTITNHGTISQFLTNIDQCLQDYIQHDYSI